MKQKNNSSNDLVTKDFLKKEFVTKDYFKTELDSRFTNLLHGIRQEIEFSAEAIIDKVEKRMQEINDRNFTKLDSISKELEGMRQDRLIGDHQNQQVKEKVESHEKPIGKLEQVQQAV